MWADILHELGLTAEQTPELPASLRTRLVYYLLRWRLFEPLSSCLDELLEAKPTLVSLLDVRARMLLEQRAFDEALETVLKRQRLRTSVVSRALEVRIHLARGDLQTALGRAGLLVSEAADRPVPWAVLGAAQMAAGNREAAEAAYQRVKEIRPETRAYLWGKLELARARGDLVTASAYAARLQEWPPGRGSVSVSQLRRLREYFQESREPNRAAGIDAELASRRKAGFDSLREAIAQELGRAPAQRAVCPTQREPPPSSQPASGGAALIDSFASVPVSQREREHLASAAQRLFGIERLWPGQAEIMACTMRGENVLAVLPTGGGKSLCYQLPALLAESGTTLVISPLVALMKDQVDNIPRQVSDRVTCVNYLLTASELRRRLTGIRAGRFRLVYAAPERLRRHSFLHALRRGGVNRLVIDEVHCVSTWGHDFRPDYLYIPEARCTLGEPPMLAMTATAAPRVRRDILQRLGEMRVIAGEVMRPNLRLEVFQAHNQDEKLRHLLGFCKSVPGSGIVYAGTRARCETLAELLRCQGVSAMHYHAGIEARAAAQDQFMDGKTRIVVATVAFGLGIDKPDIRFILHFAPPHSLEEYYQEAGRAGLPARCELMYAPSDRAGLTRHARRNVLKESFLRDTYDAIQMLLAGALSGRVALDDLRRELKADETPVRVALQLLEQVGVAKRWADMPRTVTVRLRRSPSQADAEWEAFLEGARLRPNQWVERDLLGVAKRANLDPGGLEQCVLRWADAGLLDYRPSARDPFLEILRPPREVWGQMRTLLEQYDHIQRQRVAEIVAYAKTRRCRHGHISAYLAGRSIVKCTSCDNCMPAVNQPVPLELPQEGQQLRTILGAARRGWGQGNLIWILRGRAEAPSSAHANAHFGALAYRSGSAIQKMIARLIGAGFLQRCQLDHGGEMLKLTTAGRRASEDPSMLSALTSRPTERTRRQPKSWQKDGSRSADVASVSDEDPLLQRLCSWRLETARIAGLPAFVVAHTSVLRSIAAQRPRTESELLAVKGIGPAKLAKYGAELLAIVRECDQT